MVSISLCMIVRDEEKNLANCLDSIHDLVDEIIIVDTGSIDNTKEIAGQYTSHIYDFTWIDDFAAARNYSFSKASKDFILWLDADDVIMSPDRETFKLLKEDLTLEFDAVIMKYILRTDEDGHNINSAYRERLVKSANNYQWHDPVHEYLDFDGVILHTEIAVTHTKTASSGPRNIKLLEKIMTNPGEVHPRYLFYYAQELQLLGYVDEAIANYLKFLDRPGDATSHYVESCIRLATIYMERNQKKEALRVLIRSFEYEPLRAEVLCLIGQYYRESLDDYATAVRWLELALVMPKPKVTWEFTWHDYWDFIPCLELCHCYYWLGDKGKSLQYHRRAQQIKPNHPAVLYNQTFFALSENK